MSGFTGTGAMGVGMEKPLGLAAPKALCLPMKKKKDRKTVVREAAMRVVDRLLDDEQSDTKTAGICDGTGRHA